MTTSYITYAQLVLNVRALLKKLPRSLIQNLAGILGVPRSGMLPATMIANHLHLPLSDVSSFSTLGWFPSGGKRLLTSNPTSGTILVVDDSAHTGGSMAASLQQLEAVPAFKYVSCAVYRCPEKQAPVDYYALDVPKPRYFEWNLLQHPDLGTFMLDLDGVLCYDPVQDDDGQGYVESITNATPYHLPRFPVHSICTMRLKRHREVTECWLSKHGVQYRSLNMVDLPTASARCSEIRSYGRWKGKLYKESDAQLFVESDKQQAGVISLYSEKPVICLENNTIYQEDLG